ncbi:hypothetical protein PR202_ga10837 [Eleusine coracana subsp. coracana]|uniref:Uncharacterized protein n=1 Tax=Eleusine coracana subsp. coracana TaxID=191504 RepID=A0AAV5C7N4_ELECO|nr:hypothetical protein PR202_ga10837 [Eleusine coracana subsp. coracana]
MVNFFDVVITYSNCNPLAILIVDFRVFSFFNLVAIAFDRTTAIIDLKLMNVFCNLKLRSKHFVNFNLYN